MRVYKYDILGYNHDEVLTDAYDIQEVDDIVYEVKTKLINKDLNVTVDTGANASEEETEDGVDNAGVVQVINLVDSCRLTETAFSKKDYQVYIKGYMKALLEKLQESNPSRVDKFKTGAMNVVKNVIAKFDDYKFYQGENMDADGIVVLAYYKGEETAPTFVYFKDGLESVKY